MQICSSFITTLLWHFLHERLTWMYHAECAANRDGRSTVKMQIDYAVRAKHLWRPNPNSRQRCFARIGQEGEHPPSLWTISVGGAQILRFTQHDILASVIIDFASSSPSKQVFYRACTRNILRAEPFAGLVGVASEEMAAIVS